MHAAVKRWVKNTHDLVKNVKKWYYINELPTFTYILNKYGCKIQKKQVKLLSNFSNDAIIIQ